MEKRPTPFKKPSALDQRHNSTAPTPRSNDLQRAVDDIREAAARITRLTAKSVLPEVEVRQ